MVFVKGQVAWNKGVPRSKKIKEKLRKIAIERGFGKYNKGKKRPDMVGKNNPRWNGYKTIKVNGYVLVLERGHPNSDKGYVYEHRLVIEKHLGRYLKASEIVHHLNGKKGDNRLKNLRLFANQSEHRKYHYESKNDNR